MNAALQEFIAFAAPTLWAAFVVFLRVGSAVAMMPGFGERSVPTRIKLFVSAAFTIILLPAIPIETAPPNPSDVIAVILVEVSIGLLLGIGIRLFILALQTAGTIVAQSTSLSQVLGGASVEPVPAMGHILVVAAICLAVATGLHVKAAAFLLISYDFFPVSRVPSGQDVAQWGLDQVRHAFSLAFALSMPFVILSLLYNVTLGVINKAMPQLMVAFVGAPVITLGGLVLLLLAAPTMLVVWLNALDLFLVNPIRTIP